MSEQCVITGTDTDVGKTVVSAMLMLALGASYWKPVQCGLAGGVDTKAVQRMTQLPASRFLEERYILSEPLSPHRAAELDNVTIDIQALNPPQTDGALLIEGAGGLMVPMNRERLQIDVFKKWNLPVILVARTGLGTINHTLLSLEALAQRRIALHGIIFTGDENTDTIRTIREFSKVRVLGRLPVLDSLNPLTLSKAFEDNFVLKDFMI
ncbi:MAG: ATP-dependent dethiobiotin synthetase BioD [Alphaproteobacteria bacterium]|nr:ATP-dependent dethiobiotin synthetase BioD [Alphaproteobacteria bacterium]